MELYSAQFLNTLFPHSHFTEARKLFMLSRLFGRTITIRDQADIQFKPTNRRRINLHDRDITTLLSPLKTSTPNKKVGFDYANISFSLFMTDRSSP